MQYIYPQILILRSELQKGLLASIQNIREKIVHLNDDVCVLQNDCLLHQQLQPLRAHDFTQSSHLDPFVSGQIFSIMSIRDLYPDMLP